MATYNWQVAKTVLTDNDKDRLVCLYLNRRPDGSINWDKATAEFESASTNSMKVSLGNSLKKVEKAGGKVDGDGNSSVIVTPTPKKTGGKKRAVTPGEGDQETPAPKRGRQKKQVKEAAVDSAEEDASKEEPAVVKSELED